MTMIGIDIGGTNFRIGAVDDNGTLLKFDKVPVKTILHSGDVLADLAETIRSFSENMEIEAAAIGFPATLNADRSAVIQAPNIPFMENLPVCEILSEKLGIPVYAERDVTYALCYDMAKYHVDEAGITCGIYYGTGIGNAIAINGIPLVGRHGTAGELGHIPVAGSEEPCGCGNKGCLEAAAGGKALAKLQREQFPETEIKDLFLRHADDPKLAEFLNLMSLAAATEINILDPDHVLIGGGVFNMNGFPMETFREKIMEKVRKPLPYNDLDLIFTEDEREKCVIGAAAYAKKQMNTKK